MILTILVNASGLALLLQQKFFFAEQNIWIIPGQFQVSFTKFSVLVNLLASAISVIHSIIIRRFHAPLSLSKTTPRDNFRKEVNLLSTMLWVYSFLLAVFEGAAYFQIEITYPRTTIYITSAILLCLAIKLRLDHAIGNCSATAVGSISVGKTISLLPEAGNRIVQNGHKLFLRNIVIWTLFSFSIAAPYFFLAPISSSSNNRNSMIKKHRHFSKTNKHKMDVYTLLMCYCGFISPIAILSVIPIIIMPAVGGIFGHTYYRSLPTYSESFGYSLFTWGLSTLGVLRYCLPEGGLRGLRKAACAAFVLGSLLIIVGPGLLLARERAHTNSFYLVSSSEISMQRREINGAWGLVSVMASLILCFFGYIDIPAKPRRHVGWAHVLSILFGSGLAWFLTNQLVEHMAQAELVFVSFSTSLIGYLQSYSTILIYNADSTSANSVINIALQNGFGSLMLLVIMVLVDFSIHGKVQGFRLGGGHTASLISFSTFLFILCIVTKLNNKVKGGLNMLVNISSTVSWIVAITAVYSTFGLIGIGVQCNKKFVMGTPVSPIENSFTTCTGPPFSSS